MLIKNKNGVYRITDMDKDGISFNADTLKGKMYIEVEPDEVSDFLFSADQAEQFALALLGLVKECREYNEKDE